MLDCSLAGRLAGGRAAARLPVLLLACLAWAVPAAAGEFTLAWEGVANPDLGGYRIYYGRASRSYTRFVDVGPTVTRHTLQGLDDCVTWFVAMKSLDFEGRESAEYSGEIVGFPRPMLSALSPDLALAGSRMSVSLIGSSLQAGGQLSSDTAGATVADARVAACDRIEAVLDLAAGMSAAAVGLTWTNPDGVPSAGPARLRVVSDPGPVVLATAPADGAAEVIIGVQPQITFDRELAAGSVTPDTVRLLDVDGTPVAQAVGSPFVAAGVVTVAPAAPLAQGGRYRLQVVGGDGGVQDASGNPAVSGFLQSVGFQMSDPPPGTVPALRRTDTAPPE